MESLLYSLGFSVVVFYLHTRGFWLGHAARAVGTRWASNYGLTRPKLGLFFPRSETGREKTVWYLTFDSRIRKILCFQPVMGINLPCFFSMGWEEVMRVTAIGCYIDFSGLLPSGLSGLMLRTLDTSSTTRKNRLRRYRDSQKFKAGFLDRRILWLRFMTLDSCLVHPTGKPARIAVHRTGPPADAGPTDLRTESLDLGRARH